MTLKAMETTQSGTTLKIGGSHEQRNRSSRNG
nr:MAG TPA: hypothetical protein [Caudoviricetes sp.]